MSALNGGAKAATKRGVAGPCNRWQDGVALIAICNLFSHLPRPFIGWLCFVFLTGHPSIFLFLEGTVFASEPLHFYASCTSCGLGRVIFFQ